MDCEDFSESLVPRSGFIKDDDARVDGRTYVGQSGGRPLVALGMGPACGNLLLEDLFDAGDSEVATSVFTGSSVVRPCHPPCAARLNDGIRG